MQDLKNIEITLAGELVKIKQELGKYLSIRDKRVVQYLDYVKKTRGKQLRAKITLLAAKAYGKVSVQVRLLAIALELFHQATLIHDDIIDQADKRRNHPSLNMKFGNETAVMLGDFIFTRVMQILSKNIPKEIQTLVIDTSTKVCLGEIQELDLRNLQEVSIDTYIKIISNKTASLFKTCAEAGALLGGANKVQANRLAKYGQNLGMAFQLQDDLLDFTGNINKLGKPVGLDLKRGYITLPLLLGLQKSKDKKKFKQKLGSKNISRIEIVKFLLKNGVIVESKDIIAKYIKQAQKQLIDIKKPKIKQALLDAVNFVGQRSY